MSFYALFTVFLHFLITKVLGEGNFGEVKLLVNKADSSTNQKSAFYGLVCQFISPVDFKKIIFCGKFHVWYSCEILSKLNKHFSIESHYPIGQDKTVFDSLCFEISNFEIEKLLKEELFNL